VLDGIPVGDLGPTALLAITILLILLGRLIPRPTYNEKKEECERWRLAYETERDARQISDLQTAELLELAQTTHALISAIVRPKDIQQSGGLDVAIQAPPGPHS
jgi:hypothetical protein